MMIELKENDELLIGWGFNCNQIVRSYSNYSTKFSKGYHELGGIKISMKYLKDSYIVKNYKFTRIIVGSLLNLSRAYDSFSNMWIELDSIRNVLKIMEKYKEHDDFRMSACKIEIAKILN